MLQSWFSVSQDEGTAHAVDRNIGDVDQN